LLKTTLYILLPSLIISLLIALTCIDALAEPKFNFTDHKSYAILKIDGQNRMMRNCLKVGLELKYRFSAQLCRRQDYWYDDCGSIRKSFSQIKFDPILSGYLVEKDLLSDEDRPFKERVNSYLESIKLAQTSTRFFYSVLGEGKERFGVYPLYIRAQAKVYCNENYNSTLARVAKFVSFGLLKLGSFESDWVEFSIKPLSP
jgi:hypothetical protein